jgi:DNA polymerase-3 subunit epsilon
MTWTNTPMVAFDLETTGVDVETARIVTASVLGPLGMGLLSDTKEWLIDPGIDIPAEATAVHRVTTEHARQHGLPATRAVEEITAALTEHAVAGRPVVIFNASYDLTLLDRECRRHQVTPLADILGEDMPLFVVDPLVIDREWIPRRTGKGVRRLTYLCQHVYGVPLSDSDAHGSTADALAAARVAWVQARRFPALGAMPLPLLQKRQAMWHRRWADEFGAWLASQGKPDDVERDWPMRQGGPA